MKSLINYFFLFLLTIGCYSENIEDFNSSFFVNNVVTATKRIRLDDFPGAYNPSIIRFKQGYILTFRYLPDPIYQTYLSYIGIVLLDENLEKVSHPQLLSTRGLDSNIPSQSEDARIFSYRGRLFLIYNDSHEKVWYYLDRRDMYIAELFYEEERFLLSAPLKLKYEKKYHVQAVQKNWVPFEWDNTLLLSYSISPHEVIYPNFYDGICYPCYETAVPMPWDYGVLRGSTPPLLVDGEYLAFFHSGKWCASAASFGLPMWHYFAGAYTFSAQPPFNITKMTPSPIVGEGFYTPSECEKRVIFPGGFVISGDNIYMAYGKDDCEVWIATINKKALKKALVPCIP